MRKLVSKLLYFGFLVLVLFLAGEIFLRVRGNTAWKVQSHEVEVVPGGSLFRLDPELGYRGREGRFKVIQNNEIIFTVTMDSLGERIVPGIPADSLIADSTPEVWVLGCSFTFGWGVNDGETYVTNLQEQFPEWKFRNFGGPGYSTYHSWMQLQDALEQGSNPDLVILAYGSFHDQRNVASRFWHKAVAPYDMLDSLEYPFIRFDENGQLKGGMGPLQYNPWPGMGWSAFIHYLETRADSREEDRLQAKTITDSLIRRINQLSMEHKADFLLAGIYDSESTRDILNDFEARGVNVLDISMDLEAEGLTILPGDGHPNATAHDRFAKKIALFLKDWMQNHP